MPSQQSAPTARRGAKERKNTAGSTADRPVTDEPYQSTVLFHPTARGIMMGDLPEYAKRLQADVAGGRTFVCMLAGDAELQRLNRDFRKKNYPTDVLSFPDGGSGGSLGEIAISVGRARAQAAELGHSVDEEIRILMLHGVLHLAGMDHEKDTGEMSRAERKWRKRYRLPVGLIERVNR